MPEVSRRASRILLILALTTACATEQSVAPTLERGELALAKGDAEDAADAFDSALAMRPHDSRALHGRARTDLALGDGESAMLLLAILESRDPVYFHEQAEADHRLALHQAARTRMWRGDATGALKLVNILREIEPERDASLQELRFQALIVESGRLQVAGRPEEAAARYREATGFSVVGVDAVAALAETLMDIGEAGAAVTVLSDELQRHPDDPRLVPVLDRALDVLYPDAP